MVMDADHESAEHSVPPSEAFVNQVDLLTPAEEPGSSSSLSSSSTGSSLSASFFRLDESKSHEDDRSVTSLSISNGLPPKERADPSTSESLPSLSGWEEHTTEAGHSFQFPRALSEPVQPNPEGFFQVTSGSPQKLNEVYSGKETTPQSPGSVSTPTSVQTESVMQSPPVQVMERPEITSTYRIPSHVFERSKSTNPAEWSVASNESLFSIQVGNSSFSRDHTFRLGKSGEIFSPNTPQGMAYSKSPLAPIPAVDSENRVSGLEEDLGLLDAAAPGTAKDIDGAKEDQNKPRVQIVEATRSPPRHISQGSGTGPHAAFGNPLKKRKKRKKCCGWLCCCFECCQPCSECAWPSCSCSKCCPDCCNFTCRSCSCSKHGSTCCSCSNCTPKCCHCGWPSCSCSKCFKGCCHCSCSSCCKPCSCCGWPSCSSCFSCRKCCRCKWPSCNCCCPCSSCKWPSCPCSSCSLMCCKWPWTSCCKSGCCKSCQFKSPPCCIPNCSGCCCHCTGVSCYRCKCSCTICIYKV